MSEPNPYAAPKAQVGSGAPEESADAKPGVGARFLWTAAIGYPVYMFFVLFLPKEAWLMGALGSAIFAAFSGLIAMCIPVRNKAGFIVPAILIGVIGAYILGSSTS